MTEFSRLYRVDALSEEPRAISVEADPAELGALAKRFSLPAVDRLRSQASLVRRGDAVQASGRLEAEVVQSCVASGEPVPSRVDEAFAIEFRPEPDEPRGDDEVELSESELDVVFYKGGSIDFGDAVAETLALSLDPFPRSPAAEAALREAGVRSEEDARAASNPFGALAALKDKLGK